MVAVKGQRELPDWQGQTAIVVGSGPSAARTPLELARGRARVIACNNSWQLVPWADMLFAVDAVWWTAHNGVPEFAGRRVTSSPYAMETYGIDCFIAVGETSGLRAIYLAEKMKANPILLVGFEMHPRNGTHWHPPHTGNIGMRNPGENEMKRWREDIEHVAHKFAARGTKIINCTPDSALTCFPNQPFEEALDAQCQV